MGFYQKSTLFANGLEFIAMAKVGRLQMKGDSYTLKIFCNPSPNEPCLEE